MDTCHYYCEARVLKNVSIIIQKFNDFLDIIISIIIGRFNAKREICEQRDLDGNGVHIDGLVVTDGEQLVPCRVELDGPDLVAVLLEGVDALLGTHLPHLQSLAWLLSSLSLGHIHQFTFTVPSLLPETKCSLFGQK